MWRRQYGVSLLETLLVVALVLVFVLLASQRIMELRHAAERVGVQRTIATLQSALGTQMGVLVLQRGPEALPALHLSNPVALLDPPPPNDLGEHEGPPEPLPPGSWYFDRGTRELVYRVRYPEQYHSEDWQQPQWLRLQLRAHQHDGALQRISLDVLHPYRWQGASVDQAGVAE